MVLDRIEYCGNCKFWNDMLHKCKKKNLDKRMNDYCTDWTEKLKGFIGWNEYTLKGEIPPRRYKPLLYCEICKKELSDFVPWFFRNVYYCDECLVDSLFDMLRINENLE